MKDARAADSAATPHDLGFRMPAEWAPHAATWLAWPHNPMDWPGKLVPIPWVYAEIVRHLSRAEDVNILMNSAAVARRAEGVLKRAGANLSRVHFHFWKTDRVWTRDSGPIFVKKDRIGPKKAAVAITNWKFNAWAKYPDWRNDDQIPGRVADLLHLQQWTPTIETSNGPHRVVLEGGSIDVNGEGVMITTEECLLSEVQARNPGISREQMERVFRDYLGIEQVLWLNRGIAGDDTHGHVDDIARFVGPNTIVAVVETNRDDENYLPLQENLDRLKSARNLQGKPFKVIELPMPEPVIFNKQRLPASYANFYIANGRVLVPTLNYSVDRKALNILAEAFPSREVVGIYCGDLIWGLGAIHCMTQQQPEAES